MRMIVKRARSVFQSVMGICLIAGALAGCAGNDSGGGAPPSVAQPTGTVTGKVVSAAPGNVSVSGATVETKSGATVIGKAITGPDGKFTVSAPAGDRTVVHVEASGFAEAFPVASVSSGQTSNLGVKLVPIGGTTAVSVSSGATVSISNSAAQVTIPANGLVPKASGTPTGSVNVSLTPINPAVDPNLMPGGFTGISAAGGSAQPIESFGALLVDIRDSADTQYNLAPGKTSTIRIPLGTQSANPPATIPLWYFDETAGVWKEEGTASLQGTAPDQYYEGTVAHFSYWNADQVLDSIFVNGCVKDASSRPVAGAIVLTEGITYTGIAEDRTAADGTFRVAVRKNSRAKLGLFEFDPQTFNVTAISNTVPVESLAVDITLTNCIVKQPGPLTITTPTLVGGTVGTAYAQTLEASGGVPGYTWSLNTGSNQLPSGLQLTEPGNGTGLISGSPTAVGTTTITVKVTDSTGATKTKDFTIKVTQLGALSITTTALPPGTVGTAYSAQLTATGGTGAKSWSLSTGALPNGLLLDRSTGIISGTPRGVETANMTIQVQDSGTQQQTDQKQLILVVIGSDIGGGQLTVLNAPPSVGKTFVVDPRSTKTRTVTPQLQGYTVDSVEWKETDVAGQVVEFLLVEHYTSTDGSSQADSVIYTVTHNESGEGGIWSCGIPGLEEPCAGITFNKSAGTVGFSNVGLPAQVGAQSITLNGTLTFTPF